jgi:hypothetical protein
MTRRLIAATAILAAALTLGLTVSESAPADALVMSSVQSSVFDAGTGMAWAGSEATGSTAYDTASIGDTVSGTPTGTVTYDYYGTTACTGNPVASDPETINPDGSVPHSQPAQGPLGAGTYYFQATYDGDTTYAGSTSSCEPFTVLSATSSVTTTVFDAATNAAWTGTEKTGASAYDTAVINGAIGGFTPTGTVTYDYYGTTPCTGSPVASDTEPLDPDGSVPHSQLTQGPLGAGTYYVDATYNGDTNYAASAASTCEPFTVARATPSIGTTVFDAATNAAWSGSEATGASAYDTVTISGTISAFVPTGSVTYDYFGSGTCSGVVMATDTVTLNPDGTVPDSSATGPLGVGTFSYDASYSGDGNYAPSGTSICEPFTVKNSPEVPTVSNIPVGAVFGGSFHATVKTTGDGETSVTSSTSGVCTVAAFTVSFVGVGTCTLTAHVAASGDYVASNGSPQSFSVGRASASAPSITNLPFNPVAEGGFTATVSTDGDGTRSIVSSTTGVCTVGSDGLTVTYVAAGSCTLTAQVGTGTTHLGATGGPQTFTILPVPHGYWLVGSDGGIFTFGNSQFWGSTGNLQLQRPVVGITPTEDRNGYWLVASDGGIFSFGDSSFDGSIPGLGLHPAGSGVGPSLNAPIVGMVPSITGHGYFMVASDGGVFAFGDARYAGSCPGIGGCSGAAVAVVPDSTGNGYWLFTSSGNVYAFGDAPYYGAPPATGVAVTSAVATPDGQGYWILFSNGTVDAFGDAPSLGSPVGYTNSANPATTIFPTANGGGYWVGSARGDVFAYGDAPFLGSMAGTPLNGVIVAASGY